MSIFSSTQPSLRARILPRFPANVVAGAGMSIIRSGLTYTFSALSQLGGSTTQVQFNDGGVAGGNSGLTFDKTTQTLSVQTLGVTGNATISGNISAGGTGKTGVVAVGSLPVAGTMGRRYFVSDANATTFGSIVAAGGSNKVPVYDDGTNWRIG